MGLIDRTIGNLIRRYAVTTSSLYAMAMDLNQTTGALLNVSAESAKRLNTVFSCVRLICETYTLVTPKIMYEKNNTNLKDGEHDQNRLLKFEVNKLQSSVEFRKQLVADYLLNGHGYAQIIRKGLAGRPVEYKILPFECVVRNVDLEGLLVNYTYNRGDRRYIIEVEDMIDIADIYGESRISQNKTALQEYEAIRQFGRDTYSNGTWITGYIFGDKPLNAEGLEILRSKFQDKTKNGEVGILPQGFKYEQLRQNLPIADAAVVMAKSSTDRDVCRIFQVPPSLLGVSEHADNKGEADFNQFLATTIAPLCLLIEAELNRKIFRIKEKTHFVTHELKGLYRTSLKERYESHRIAINSGFMNPDEAREVEGMNPTEDGSGRAYIKPLNMIPSNLWEDYYRNQLQPKPPSVAK